MKKALNVLFMLTATIALSACGPVYETHYNYTPPSDWRGRQCLNQCLTERTSCRAQCAAQNQNCRNAADLTALPAYLSYQHQQEKTGQPATEGVNDFADTSSCNSDCGCDSSYRDCYTNCGGAVSISTVCTAFCPKAAPPSQNNLMPQGIR